MGNACAGETVSPDMVSIEYFEGHGRVEPLKALLHHSGTQFHFSPVGLAGWMYRKGTGNTGEMGQLPIVRYQGKAMQQFNAILRAVGVEKGYYNPRDWREAGKIDWVIDTWGELLGVNAGIFLSFNTAAQKVPLYTAAVADKWRPFLVALEKQLSE